ncbi:hypothetical protein [Ekhidna sp.]
MKKNVAIGILSILCLFFSVYSFIKADEAQKAMLETQVQRNEVLRLQKEADQLKEDALEAAAEALKQMKRAEKALQDCRGN